MAYFANGSEGAYFDSQCIACIFSEDPCPIALSQSLYNYDACNNETARKILDILVDDKTGCQFKPIIDDKIKLGELKWDIQTDKI